MKSTTTKNLLAILLIVSAAALLVVGILAFFSDRADATAQGKAGNVQLNVSDTVTATDLDNINPGDHDWGLAQYLGYTGWDDAGAVSIADGSTHEISLVVENAGNKSVKIRHAIDLKVELDADLVGSDYSLLSKDFMFFLTEEEDRSETGAAELAKKYYLFQGAEGKTLIALYFEAGDPITTAGYYAVDGNDSPVTPVTVIDEAVTPFIGIRYVVFDADPDAGYILKGTGNDAEAEASDGADGPGTYTYYLGLKAGADNRYQGAEINIEWSVEAIQHRNTDATKAWVLISSATASGKVPARNEDASGNLFIPPTP